MSTELMVNSAAFTGLAPAQAFKVLDPHAESLADGIGSSYGIMGYKGKVWSLRLRGETYIFKRPDDGSPAAFLDVIILRSPVYKSKSYYPPGTFQDGQVGARPICAALNGTTPDADILTPQSPACATCDKNVFKTNAEGRKSRDCSDYKRLAVLIVPSATKALLGSALMEPVFLRIPAASLNNLAQLGEGMNAQGFHYSSYITRIGFNPEKPHPEMTFRALQPLTDKEAPVVLPMREDAQSLRITGESEVAGGPKLVTAQVSQQPGAGVVDPAAVAAAQAEALKAEQAAQAAQAAALKKAAEEKAAAEAAAKAAAEAAARAAAEAAQTIDTGFGDVSPAPAATGVIDTGFGDIGAAAGMPPITVPVTATVSPAPTTAATIAPVSDTGPAEASDTNLDARIAALMPK